MTRLVALAVLVSAAAAAAQPPAADSPPVDPPPPPAPTPPKFETVWDNGLFVRTPDKAFVVHAGGLLHYDAVWASAGTAVQRFPGGVGRFDDGTALRRGRLSVDGTLYRDFDFFVQYEFANATRGNVAGRLPNEDVVSTPGLLDAWVTVNRVPWLGHVRVGNQREWLLLEQLNGARFLSLIERSYLFDSAPGSAFNNNRSFGVSAFRTWLDDRAFSAVGAFKNSTNPFGFALGDGDYVVDGRLIGLPVYRPDDHLLWMVGGAMSARDPVNGQVRTRVRNLTRSGPAPLANVVADTGPVMADNQVLYNLQTAAVLGPASVQAEYLVNLLADARVGTGPPQGTVAYHGWYVETTCLLTGESRPWVPATATFGRVIPKSNFGFDADGRRATGWGAWELAARYSYLDLDDKAVRGGRLRGATLGVNWYWNPNMKLQANYDYAYRDGGTNPLAKGAIHSFATRLALDF